MVAVVAAIAWLAVSATSDYERQIEQGRRQTQLIVSGLSESVLRHFNEVSSEITTLAVFADRLRDQGRLSDPDAGPQLWSLIDDDRDILRIVLSSNGQRLIDYAEDAASGTPDLTGMDWMTFDPSGPVAKAEIGSPVAKAGQASTLLPLRFSYRGVAGMDDLEVVAFTDAEIALYPYEKVALHPGSAFALFREDGTMLARWPYAPELIGQVFTGPVFAKHLPQSASGTVRAVTQLDEDERILTYSMVDEWPLVVVSTVPTSSALTLWWSDLPGKAALLLLVLSTTFLLWLALRHSQGALRRSLDELKAGEGRYARLLENLPGGVYTRRQAPSGAIDYTFASSSYRSIFGIDPQAILDDSQYLVGLIHPDDRQGFIESIAEASRQEKLWTREFRMIKPSGQLVWVRSQARPYRGEDNAIFWDGIIVDITDAQQHKALLEHVQAIAAVGHWTWEPSGQGGASEAVRPEYSPQYAAILGVSPQDLAISDAEFLQRFVHRDDRKRVDRAYREFLATNMKAVEIEYRILRQDDALRWVRETARKEIVAGATVRIVGVLQDITDAKAREAALLQSQKMEAVGNLTGGVAHDFNNLLAIIIGNLELLQSHLPADSETRKCAEAALGAAERGGVLTKRLLAFARRQSLEPRATDLVRLIAELTPLLKRSVGELIEIVISHAPDLPDAFVDPHQFENAIINISNNARDAMPNGGRLSIHVETAKLDSEPGGDVLGSDLAGTYLCVTLTDNGVGIPRDELGRVFEPFFTTKPVGQGTGLGLSMVYGLVSQSRGRLRIYSEPGVGTSIKIYLPVASAAAATEPAKAPTAASFEGMRALLVDDDVAVRATTAAQLRSLGFDVTEAAAGPETLAIIRSDLQFDVMVSDVILAGGMLGPELARQVRALRPMLPILFISGFSAEMVLGQGPEDPMAHLLRKPFRRAELATQLSELIQA